VQDVVVDGGFGKDNVFGVEEMVPVFPKEVVKQEVVQFLAGVVVGM
jgi:hypothetical protein